MPLHNQPIAQQVPELSHFPGRCCPVCPPPASPSQARSFPGSPCPKQPVERCRCIRSVQRGPGVEEGEHGCFARGLGWVLWGRGDAGARTPARPPARWGSPLPSRQAHPATGTYRAAAGCGSAPRAPTCGGQLLRPVWDGMGSGRVGPGPGRMGSARGGRPPRRPPPFAHAARCGAAPGAARGGACAPNPAASRRRRAAAGDERGGCPRSPGRVLAEGPRGEQGLHARYPVLTGWWGISAFPGLYAESLVLKEGSYRGSSPPIQSRPRQSCVPRSGCLQVLCHAWRGRAGRGSLCLGRERSYHSCLLLFFFRFSSLNAQLTRERRQHTAWMGRGLPPQLPPGRLRPSSPSRSHSGVFSPTFGSAHQGCSLAERWTWPPASFFYLSRVSQCLAVPSASSARSPVTAEPGPGGGGHPLCPFLWLKGSFQCLWHVPPVPFSVCLSHLSG